MAYRSELSGPVKEATEQFIAARQLYGHPVTAHYMDTIFGEYARWEAAY